MPSRVFVDLHKKLRLEKRLAKDLLELDQRAVRSFTRSLARTGQPIDYLDLFGEELQSILDGHYGKVGRAFNHQLGPQLASDVAPTVVERRLIVATLTEDFASKAFSQSRHIAETTQGQMGQAVSRSITEAARLASEGTPISKRETDVMAGNFLGRDLNARRGTITNFETQNPAETAKAREAEVLTEGAMAVPDKVWWSVGDSDTREHHLQADNQRVKQTDVYTVLGESLKFPGDTSLGASVKNVLRCRCSSVVDAAEVTEARRSRLSAAA